MLNVSKSLFSFIILLVLSLSAHAQLVLNEIQITNLSTIQDEDLEYNDWVELYNNSDAAIDLTGYRLSDSSNPENGWTFGNTAINAHEHRLVFLSGKNRQGVPAPFDHYEIAIYPEMTWDYIVPSNEPTEDWVYLDADLTGWSQGIGGVGYGDEDDNTVIAAPAYSVYSRTVFNLSDPSQIALFILNMDYDDAFVAYLNGVEIARANIGDVGTPPTFDSPADAGHEANGYQGFEIDNYYIDVALVQSALVIGDNVLAIQVHNTEPNSGDLTGNAYVVLGVNDNTLQTNPAPTEWVITSSFDHTTFGLSSGETLFLFDNALNLLDTHLLGSMQPDMVVKRSSDGAETWCYSEAGTPDETNEGSCYENIELQPAYNVASGLYPSGIFLTLTSPNPDAEIRYTTDGSEPNENSALYTNPLSVGATAVIAARCYSLTSLPSPIKKNTYLINESNIDIPVISISTDPDNLWNEETGIHVFGPPDYVEGVPYWGANFWEDWERQGYVEYFDANHNKQMEGPIGLKIHGGWSRINDQKSLRIQAKGKYGMEEMNYPLIQDKPYINSFKGFNLRNGGNAYWDYRFHEALMERSCRNTHVDYMAYSPAVVFLNGEYWGFMEIRENLDQHYVANNHDISANDASVVSANYMGFNIINGSPASFFDLHDFATTNNPNSPAYFSTIEAQLDVENYTDYIIAQTYWGNGDWSSGWQNNTKLWHDDRPGGKWRFMLMDMDFGMGLAGASVNDNYIDDAGDEGYLTDQLFANFIQNNTFRTYFINRYADLINTEFQSSEITAKAIAMRDEVAPIFQRHAQRWGADGGALDWPLNARLDWANQRVQGARNVVQNHFQLPSQVLITLESEPAGAGRIQISTIQPNLDNGPWQGVYFNGVPVIVKAFANPGYVFDHWAENEVFTSNNTSASIQMMFDTNIHFTAVFQGDPATQPLSITEMMFHPDSQNDCGDWLELHNNIDVPIDLSGWMIKDANFFNTFEFPNGSLLDANSTCIIASDLSAFMNAYPDVTNVFGPLEFSLSNSADSFQLLRPSGSVFLSYNYTDDDNENLACSDGCGYSRQHAADESNYSAENWTMGCLNGSPGMVSEDCNEINYVSEINYNSSPTNDVDDWIELWNETNLPLDISNWTLRDENDNFFVIPNGTVIASNARLVVASNLDAFSSELPLVTSLIGPSAISFSNAGDCIKLYDANNTLVYSMKYSDNTPWPFEADGLGKTLEFTGLGGHVCHSQSWMAGCDLGSPAQAFDPLCGGVSVSETISSDLALVYPNPTNGNVSIQLNTIYTTALILLDATGRIVWQLSSPMNFTNEIDLSTRPAGCYYLRVVSTNRPIQITKLTLIK